MFPSIKIVICGVLLSIVLLAATGSGVVTPQTYTRIGEMPEVGRPMMLRAINEEAQFHALTLTRRAEALDRLRDLAVQDTVAVTLAKAEAAVEDADRATAASAEKSASLEKSAPVETSSVETSSVETSSVIAPVPPTTDAAPAIAGTRERLPANVAVDPEDVKEQVKEPEEPRSPSSPLMREPERHDDAVVVAAVPELQPQPEAEHPNAALPEPADIRLPRPRPETEHPVRRTARPVVRSVSSTLRSARMRSPDGLAGPLPSAP